MSEIGGVTKAMTADKNLAQRLRSDDEVNTSNDALLSAGQNLPNHSTSLAGRGNFVRQSIPEIPTFRTKQAAYRYAAYLITLAEVHLPDEEGCEEHTFEVVLNAVRNA